MKVALITTTINVPRVLPLWLAHGRHHDLHVFIAGDRRTPDQAYEFCKTFPNRVTMLSPDEQSALGYRCSDLIGWNCIQRRNIALLEAVRWGADCIVSADDDNYPISPEFFGHFSQWFPTTISLRDEPEPRYEGLRVSTATDWFDHGLLLSPPAPQRGMPIGRGAHPVFEPVTDVRVGVVAGLCMGDPDVSAVERIANRPTVHNSSALLQHGIVVDPRVWTVFNSQNTAFRRELAPAFFMMPGVGRYDDIYASLIAQRIMRERGLHVHFGKPFVWQQRNGHNLFDDLRAEIDGMSRIEQFAKFLNNMSLPLSGEFGVSAPLKWCRWIYDCFGKVPNSYELVPQRATETAQAFFEDLEKVL